MMDPEFEISKSNNILTQKLYGILSRKSGNVFFSPLSVHLTLTILQMGAHEPTHKLIGSILENPDRKLIEDGYKATIKRLNSLKHVDFLMANKIYTAENVKVLDEFKNLIQQFEAEIEVLNCGNPPKAAKIVNDWVETKTLKNIKNLVSETLFQQNLSLILINAIFFKGEWVSKFKETTTKDGDFFLDNGNTVKVKMMHQKTSYWFKDDEDLGAKIIELPYKGYNVKMMIILPNENVTKLEEKLQKTDLRQLEKGLKLTEVHLFLPKFKMEETIKLNDILGELGLKDIFDMSKANFGGILDSKSLKNIYVSEMVQKAYIEVNEGGTIAAAATKAAMVLGSAPGAPKPQIFKVDHPAIFLLIATEKDKDIGNILFYGRLSHPDWL